MGGVGGGVRVSKSCLNVSDKGGAEAIRWKVEKKLKAIKETVT